MLLALALTTAVALTAAPAPVSPLPGCITMNTDNLPLNKRASPLDSLTFKVGSADVKLCYSRPSLKGRTMIGGEAVPYGQIWRTGANEPTMIHTTGMLMVGKIMVDAGSYSIYTIPGEKTWTVIVNKSITQWGEEHGYTAEVKAQEVGRTDVPAETLSAPVEKLTFSVVPNATNANALVLTWQTTKVSIPVMGH